MAIATFHSFRGEKSALIMIKANPFVMSASPAYIPASAVPSTTEKGATIEVPDGYKLTPFVDFTTGEVRKTKEGADLHVLTY